MIRSFQHGDRDFITTYEKEKLRAAILKKERNSFIANEVADNCMEFIKNGVFIEDGTNANSIGKEKAEDHLFRMKASEGESYLEKIQNYTNGIIAELIEEEKQKNNGENDREEKENIEEEIEALTKRFIDRTRTEGNNIQDPDEMDLEADVVQRTLNLIKKRSQEKERKRTKNKRMSDMSKMSVSQAIFGKNMLMYKAIKKQLKVRVRRKKEETIYISIDNSGSMREFREKALKFVKEVVQYSKEVMYTTWNEKVNGPFKRVKDKINFDPTGNDDLYSCTLESIEQAPEGTSLVVGTDGTTYLTEDEFKRILKKAKKKEIHFVLMSFGETRNYQVPKGFEDRLIASKNRIDQKSDESWDWID